MFKSYTSILRKSLLKLFLFMITFVICYYSIFFVLASISYKKRNLLSAIQPKLFFYRNITERTYRDFNKKKVYDYIFIGSSHCYKGFDPAIFKAHGISTYTFGFPAQTPLNSYYILQEVIDNAKKVVYEIYPITMQIRGYESFNALCQVSNNYPLLFKTANSVNDIQAYQMISLKPIISYKMKKQKLEEACFYEGYVCNNDSVKGKYIYYDTMALDIPVMEKQFIYFEKIMKLCKEKHKELILVYAPNPKENIYTNEHLFYENLYSLMRKYKIKLIDMGRNHNLSSKEHFCDYSHMNRSGVRIFNETLIKALQKEPSLAR